MEEPNVNCQNPTTNRENSLNIRVRLKVHNRNMVLSSTQVNILRTLEDFTVDFAKIQEKHTTTPEIVPIVTKHPNQVPPSLIDVSADP